VVKSQVRREQVALAIERGHSQRRAYELKQISRTVLGYQPTGPQRDALVIDARRRLARQHSRVGYRRIRESNIKTVLNDAGNPGHNGSDERFNGRLRDECLNQGWFRSRQVARVLIENWRRHDNEVRPHSSLQYMTHVEFHRQHASSTNPGAALE
jgi:transposase InsO family protein